jgi:hypothetical protein
VWLRLFIPTSGDRSSLRAPKKENYLQGPLPADAFFLSSLTGCFESAGCLSVGAGPNFLTHNLERAKNARPQGRAITPLGGA